MSGQARVVRFLGVANLALASILVLAACAAPAAPPPAPTAAPAKPAAAPAAPAAAPAAPAAQAAPTVAAAPAAQPAAAPAKQPELKAMKFTASAGPATSVSYAYWVGITKAIKKVYPQLDSTMWEASGALDITKRVRDKQADFGNCTSDLDYANYNGEENFQGQPNKDARILWYYDIWPFQWAVSKASGIKTIEELNGKNFNPGSAGSSMAVTTKKLFDDYGIKPVYFDAVAAAAQEAMQNRQIVGVGKGGPVPDSWVQQIHASMPVNLVGISKDQQDKAVAKYKAYMAYSIPANVYGDSQAVLTVSNMQGGQASAALPQEVGYALFRAMWEGGKDEWQAAHPQAAKNDVPALTLKSAIPLHAGTVQYLVEKGFKVPDNLIPREYKPVK